MESSPSLCYQNSWSFCSVLELACQDCMDAQQAILGAAVPNVEKDMRRAQCGFVNGELFGNNLSGRQELLGERLCWLFLFPFLVAVQLCRAT